jgi:mannose-1-phosphate guanylyltransferase/mannose-6-phosphate isomerase
VKIHPVILAGGSGTRLWPLSREHLPKPFIPLVGDGTMFQQTLRRVRPLDTASPVVVCNESHRFLALDQMREIGVEQADLVIEPVARNTAPALTLAALNLLGGGRGEDDALMLVLPADHLMQDEAGFHNAVRSAAKLAQEGFVVTFGVVPTTPHTGYGYIRKGNATDGAASGFAFSEFVEKPASDVAARYVESGKWLWNSGMFMLRASAWLAEIDHHRPDIAAACRSAYSNGHRDGRFYRPGAAELVGCPSESIDYAVMEGAARDNDTDPHAPTGFAGCAVVPLDAGWSDIGAWSVLWEQQDRDEQGNVTQGDVCADSTENALLIAQHRLLATLGVKDVAIVETPDAVLVADKGRVQEVRRIVDRLKQDGRTEHVNHRRVHRPWGTYDVLDSGPGFQVKRLTIDPGASISLQMHRQRAEHWVVVAGTARVTRGDEVFLLRENESAYVSQGTRHRIENPTDDPLQIVEVQTGGYLGEDDIVRYHDHYARS